MGFDGIFMEFMGNVTFLMGESSEIIMFIINGPGIP